MTDPRVVVVGAGVGGLVAAALLARRGFQVTVVERAMTPGGKMRTIDCDGHRIDAGPTVLTMRDVFDEHFADAGSDLSRHVTLRPASVVARHAWSRDERLDLFTDVERSADAIGAFAGAKEAAGYRAFAARSREIFSSLEATFMRAQRPRLDQLVASFGITGLPRLRRINPFSTLWGALNEHFRDPRLLQLFGRYATYCGSSPFQAPATLMLVAHTEQRGVWLVEGGMHRLAVALAELATACGARIRYGTEVRSIEASRGRVTGVTLADGEAMSADTVVVNADASALTAGLFGPSVETAAPRLKPEQRSLSAVTFVGNIKTSGFPLERHNVFFSSDYRAEFGALQQGRTPGEPTVYICAQDRDTGRAAEPDAERLLVLINAPANGDRHTYSKAEIAQCMTRSLALLTRCGLTLEGEQSLRATTPDQFAALFPATGGALYGPATHGWQASFSRPGARSSPGLYLAGGSVHPGPGVPMAALSGRLAAAAILADRGSTRTSRATATSGGISMR